MKKLLLTQVSHPINTNINTQKKVEKCSIINLAKA